jgi:hypothetical protein
MILKRQNHGCNYLTDPASLNITDEEMQQIVQPHLNAIMKEQKIKQRIKNNTILSPKLIYKYCFQAYQYRCLHRVATESGL